MFWKARRALANVPAVEFASMPEEERAKWRGKTFLCPRASHSLFHKVRAIAQEWRVQAVWAVNGSFKPSDDPLKPSMSRGCVRHDGVCVRRALASEGDDSAFLAEFAAQLDVLAEEGCRDMYPQGQDNIIK